MYYMIHFYRTNVFYCSHTLSICLAALCFHLCRLSPAATYLSAPPLSKRYSGVMWPLKSAWRCPLTVSYTFDFLELFVDKLASGSGVSCFISWIPLQDPECSMLCCGRNLICRVCLILNKLPMKSARICRFCLVLFSNWITSGMTELVSGEYFSFVLEEQALEGPVSSLLCPDNDNLCFACGAKSGTVITVDRRAPKSHTQLVAPSTDKVRMVMATSPQVCSICGSIRVRW